MHLRLAGGADHGVGIHLAEARDVLGDGAVEERDILGLVTDMLAEIAAAPFVDIDAVQAHRAAQRRPDAHQEAR